MTRLARVGVVGLCVISAAGIVVSGIVRGTAPGVPSKAPAVAAATSNAKGTEDLLKELSGLHEKMAAVMPTAKLLGDAKFRAGDGQKVLPLLKETVRVMGDVENALKSDPKLKDQPEIADEIRTARFHAMAFAAALGDKDSATALENQATWDPSAEGVKANCAWKLSKWIVASNDAAAQKKILEDFAPTIKENAENEEIVSTLLAMMSMGPANEEMSKQVVATIRDNMKGPIVTNVLKQIEDEQAQKAMVGNPLMIEGRTSTGGKFSSAVYKGKVVMVDFWATWCGPCIAELPDVKKVYAAYHDKGFEIVGVSCDSSDDEVNAFIKDKGMPWVQLRETSQTEVKNWHPVATQNHVNGIPQMFLIDRNGILRHVDAREDLENEVGRLIAEKVPANQPAGK